MNNLRRATKIIREQGLRSFLIKSLLFLKNKVAVLFILPYAIFRIKILKIYNLDLTELVDFSFYGVFGLIRPTQVSYEILELLKIIDKTKPKTILEIGTANGGTLFLLSRIASEDAKIISVDLPSKDGGYPRWKTLLYKAFKKPKQEMHLVRGNSHSNKTFEEVMKVVNGNKVDFLFIDGDHSYEGVKKDFELYKELVRDDGFIAFHDIVPDYSTRYGITTSSYTGGVPIFWNEIKGSYRYNEIIANPDQDGYGIGILEG